MIPAALGLGAAVGLLLGLAGGGGALLAVPLLGLLGLAPAAAKAGALLVVAAAALAGLGPHLRAGSVDLRAAALVGGAGAPASLLVARASRGLPDALQAALFGLVALVAGALLLRPAPPAPEAARSPRPGVMLLAGALAGALTGLVGVGGGFVLVPTLTLVVGLPPARAVGTSLVVVALNACAGLAGLAGDVTASPVLLGFVGAAAAGAVGGGALAPRVPQARLRQGLGALLVLVGLAVLGRALVASV